MVKILLKAVFVIAVLSFLVLMGMHNRSTVPFDLPPLLPQTLKLPSALMYYAFFAIGFLTGVVLFAGGKKGGGEGKSKRVEK
ncbi:MAG: hypothetical protein WCO56_25805 [Verrucomicrobiota bacterium]